MGGTAGRVVCSSTLTLRGGSETLLHTTSKLICETDVTALIISRSHSDDTHDRTPQTESRELRRWVGPIPHLTESQREKRVLQVCAPSGRRAGGDRSPDKSNIIDARMKPSPFGPFTLSRPLSLLLVTLTSDSLPHWTVLLAAAVVPCSRRGRLIGIYADHPILLPP